MPKIPVSNHPGPYGVYRWLKTPYPYLEELKAKLGPTFRMNLLGFSINIFSNPDDVREIFAEPGEELQAGRSNVSTLGALLGDKSVLMVDGAEHKRKRRLLLPPFQGERMQAYGKTMLDITDDLIDDMPHSQSFALHEPMQDITLRIIIRTIFGFEGAPLEAMMKSTKKVLELASWPPLLIPALQIDHKWTHYGRFRAAAAATDALLHRNIDEKLASGQRGSDILSLLLDARDEEGQPMSRDELRDDLVTLLVAGHETTATALTWAVRWLLENPFILKDLRAEMEALGPEATPEQIAKAPLLDGVVREALRLIPVIPFIGRMLSKDRTVGGYDLKKDETVVGAIYLAHRREEAFPNATKFDPTRFIGKKVTPHEFFPFGGGIRRCIGTQFALYEMKMVLARLVMRTELVLDPKKPLGMERRSITITPTNGLRVVMTKRRLRKDRVTVVERRPPSPTKNAMVV